MEEQNELNKADIQGRQMVYAADGTLLRKRDGVQSQLSNNLGNNDVSSTGFAEKGLSHHISSNGQYLGEISEFGSSSGLQYRMSFKDQHFSSAPDSASAQSKYQVQAGDTLRSLALAFYGNSDYWYLIANSNGLTGEPDKALSAGLAIDIPARANTTNSHNSFKPMDLQQIIGDTTPAVPYLPPPPRAGCNALAAIVITVVAIAVAYASQGTMKEFAASVVDAAWAKTAVAYAGAAAAGDAAGQMTAIALNQQNGFNAGQTLRTAGTAFVTAGVADKLLQTAPTEVGPGTWASRTAQGVELSGYGRALVAASGALTGMAANRLMTGHSQFSWSQIAAQSLVASAGGRLPLEGSGNVIADTFMGIGQSGLQYGLAKALGDDKMSWNFRNVATDAFGNAIGNSIVGHLNTQEVARQANAAMNASSANRLSSAVDTAIGNRAAGLEHTVYGWFDSQIPGAFDLASAQQMAAADTMLTQAADKRASAIDGYLKSRDNSRQGIADIDVLALAGRRRRQQQSAQTKAYYGNKALDFRMDNPVYRTPAPLFDSGTALAADNAMWGAGKQRGKDLRNGIAAGIDLIERSAQKYVLAFEKAYDRFDQIMNKGFDSFIDQPADGVRVFTDTYSLQWAHSTFTAGGELIFGFQSDGKVAVGLSVIPAGVKVDTGRGPEVGYSRLYWEPAAEPADLETVLNSYGTSTGVMINTPRIGSFGIINSVSWKDMPVVSPKAAIGKGWSWGMPLNPNIDSVFKSPITPVANYSYGEMIVTEPFDLGWLGKGIYWGLK